MTALSYLIAGVAVYGFAGWLGDHFLGTGFLLPLGIVLGAAAGVFMIIKRFGDLPAGVSKRSGNAQTGPPAGSDNNPKESQP